LGVRGKRDTLTGLSDAMQNAEVWKDLRGQSLLSH
jgi:hypothetical protein